MIKELRNSFVSGLVLLAPLGVTIIVVNFLLVRVGTPASNILFQFVDPALRTAPWVATTLSIISTVIVVVTITVLGYCSNFFLGRIAVNIAERIINALPFVNSVYKTVKQIVDTFSKQQRAVFQRCVLIEYPRKGVFVLGFQTGDAKGEVQHRTGSMVSNIFVPTTPNPTSGFLLMVPVDEIIPMDMTITDGMKLIISGGAVIPPFTAGAGQAEPIALKNPVAAKGIAGENATTA